MYYDTGCGYDGIPPEFVTHVTSGLEWRDLRTSSSDVGLFIISFVDEKKSRCFLHTCTSIFFYKKGNICVPFSASIFANVDKRTLS